MNPMINIGIQAVREASKLLLRSMEHLEAVELKFEQRQQFTAELKRLVAEEITQLIHKAHPSHATSTANAPELGTRGEPCWLIDAISGEINFAHSLPHFAISLAIKLQNKITGAIIYDFLRDELFTASNGQGARLNDRRLRVSQTRKVSEALIASSETHNELSERCQALRYSGCPALDLAYVAAARCDAYVTQQADEINTAAGVLLVTEAGGMISQGASSLIAASPKVYKELL